ncbi:MAG TPA: fibronectin type III domain-containing protein [Verrucomicrobiae bacterium]|nr:fibronectin type III domain-containing protein [Verrucomicrobiae bacterium]
MLFRFLLGLVALSFAQVLAWSVTLSTNRVTLAWNPAPGAAGYRIYTGTASRNYSSMLDVGPSTTATIGSLRAGTTYFFAATDYDTNQLESAYSAEISYTVPAVSGQTRLSVNLSATGQKLQISGVGPVGYTYLLQTSSDLVTWTNLANVTNSAAGTFQFADLVRVSTTRRYYRLQQTSP